MKLLLVQHGESKSKDIVPERALTDAGIRKSKKIASWLGRHHVNIEQIIHSGKKRAAQTADIFANRLAPAKGVKGVSGLSPNDDVLTFADQLAKQNGVLMVVGHLPFLDRLASFLVTGDQDQGVVSFVNSGVVCLAQDQDSWSVIWAVVPELLTDS